MSLLKRNATIWILSFLKLPLLFYIRPVVTKYDEKICHIKVKLKRRSQNHLNSMYFGALTMGAELSIAAIAVFEIRGLKKPIDFIFKDFKCQFIKRADTDVIFISESNLEVKQMLLDTLKSKERIERTLNGKAVSDKNPELVFMTYSLTLSVKARTPGR